MTVLEEQLLINRTKEIPPHDWYVVYTKSRHEKKATEMLNQLGIEAYCPIKIQVKVWSDRKKKVEVPLFNSYVFVRLQAHQLRSVFEVPSIVRYIYWCGQPATVKAKEIEEIKRWLGEFDHSAIVVESFEVNQKIKIGSGSFKDQEASVVKQKGNHLTLRLEALDITLRLKINETYLEKAV